MHRHRPASPAWRVLLVAVGSLGCLGSSATSTLELERCTARTCVLFVGNSLTYVNDVPGIVAELARASGVGTLQVAQVTAPDVDLRDHWQAGAAQSTIASGRWTHVVLQQGPSAREESRALLRDYVARFAPVVRAAGARPALYMTWPQRENAADFPRSSESYRLAAADVDALLLPVGDAWRAAWRREPTLALYADDGLHQSGTGAYLAALVIYGQLFDRSTVGLPATVHTESGTTVAVASAVAAVLQAAADEARAAPPAAVSARARRP